MNPDDSVRDRLDSLRGSAVVDIDSHDRQKSVLNGDNANAFQRGIDLIYRNTKAIVVLEQRAGQASSSQTARQLDAIMNKTRAAALKMKAWLDKEEAKVAVLEGNPNPGSTVAQMKRNKLRTNQTKFREAMLEFGRVSEHFRDVLKQQVERQARVINAGITESQMQQVLNGRKTDAFASALERNGQLLATVEDMESQRQGMQAIHDGIRDIQELFVDLKLLVDEQQENLNLIEENVVMAAERAQAGRVNIDKALVYSQRARRRKCYLYLVLIIVAIVGIVFLLWSNHVI